MTINLVRYLVELAIGGINVAADPKAEHEFDYELSMRPHVFRKQLYWDEKRGKLVVQVEIDSLNEELAVKQMAEELFEIANAVLKNIKGVNVKELNVNHVEPNE
jgi:phenylacetate-coenzyme A ligase PaaK-like adenylate-forming protein